MIHNILYYNLYLLTDEKSKYLKYFFNTRKIKMRIIAFVKINNFTHLSTQ